MKRMLLVVVAAIVLAGAQNAFPGQIIGQITDPCNMSIDDYTDILSAWVEKGGTNLTFVMTVRGPIPNPSQLQDYNDTITYIWLADADNDPATGQSPGQVGSEFNIRAVISQNPILAGGYVDIVGALQDPGTGGTGTVQIVGNTARITVNRSQIASVRRLHWRSDAWKFIDGVPSSFNGLTESGLARPCRYGVLPVPDSQYFQVGDSYLRAALETDPCNPIIDLTNVNGGNFFVCLPVERKYPDQDNAQINAQATGHSGPGHLRMLTRFDVVEADPAVFGYAEGIAIFDGDFYLDGDDGETGPIPPGVFELRCTHDYHLFASDMVGQAYSSTFAQIVINQVDPLEQKGVWVHQERMQNEERFGKYTETIDLADYGLELGVAYRISVLLVDRAEFPEPSPAGGDFSDSSMLTSIDVAYVAGDIDDDWDVDLYDFAQLADNWLTGW